MSIKSSLNDYADRFMLQFDQLVIGELTDPFLGEDDVSAHIEQKYDFDFSAAFARLDSKASGLLTHISMMIAIGALVISIGESSVLEKVLVSIEFALYLFFALCCLRALTYRDVIKFKNSKGTAGTAQFMFDYQDRYQLLLRAEYINFVCRWLFLLTFIFALSLIAHVML